MTVKVPDYFLKFKCIADRCNDSCCIGWEIDIDAKTMEKYASTNGEIGAEIRKKTQHGCFPLTKSGRCAFLDDDGLCRIISALGEQYLCDICREHPRYYGIGGCGLEGGLGMACPEAAKIILSIEKKPSFCEVEAFPSYFCEDEYAEESEKLRELIYDAIYGKSANELPSVMMRMAKYADDLSFSLVSGLAEPSFNDVEKETVDIDALLAEAIGIFTDCEAISEDWQKRLLTAKNKASQGVLKNEMSMNTQVFRALLFYFTHRYVRECIEDMSAGARVAFALLSSLAVFALRATYGESGYESAAVLFSKNIEYSTDNIDAALDKIACIL